MSWKPWFPLSDCKGSSATKIPPTCRKKMWSSRAEMSSRSEMVFSSLLISACRPSVRPFASLTTFCLLSFKGWKTLLWATSTRPITALNTDLMSDHSLSSWSWKWRKKPQWNSETPQSCSFKRPLTPVQLTVQFFSVAFISSTCFCRFRTFCCNSAFTMLIWACH